MKIASRTIPGADIEYEMARSSAPVRGRFGEPEEPGETCGIDYLVVWIGEIEISEYLSEECLGRLRDEVLIRISEEYYG